MTRLVLLKLRNKYFQINKQKVSIIKFTFLVILTYILIRKFFVLTDKVLCKSEVDRVLVRFEWVYEMLE